MSNECLKIEYSKRDIVYLLLILIFAFSIKINFFHEPFERDEGLYGVIGQEILRGGLPYVNGIENKPPIIYYVYSGMIALLGNDVFRIRVATALFSLLTLLALFKLAERIFDKRGAYFAAILYAFFASGPAIRGTSSQCEVFMLLPLLLAFIFLIDYLDNCNKWKAVLAGTMMGLALLIKTTALPYLLFLLIYLVSFGLMHKRAKIFYDIALVLSPVFGLIALFVMYFAYNHALDEFKYWNYTYHTLSREISFSEKFTRFINRGKEVSMEHLPLWLMGVPSIFYLLWCIIVKKVSNCHHLVALALIPVSMVAIYLPSNSWPHYYILIIPALVIASSGGLSALSHINSIGRNVSWLLVVLALGFSFAREFKYYTTWSPQEISSRKYNTDIFASSEEIARYIKFKTLPEDYIFQWGWQPELYFLTDRRCPNPFQSMIFTFSGPDLVKDVNFLLNSIINLKPKYIVIQSGRESWPGYEQFMEIVNSRYIYEKSIGYGAIYRIANIK